MQEASADVQALLARVTIDDIPRWMVRKGNLDHGPFTNRELVELILKGEANAHTPARNLETGYIGPLEGVPQLNPFLAHLGERQRRADQLAADHRATQNERLSLVVKLGIATLLLAICAGAGVVFWNTRSTAKVDISAQAEEGVASLFDDDNDVRLTPEEARKRGKRRAPRKSSGSSASAGESRTAGPEASGNSARSYEEAMSQATKLGDVTQGGGEQRLTPDQIQSTINRQLRALAGCANRGSEHVHGSVKLSIAIAGSGAVLGTSVDSEGGEEFESCVANRMQQVKFPTFSAPRMGAKYVFNLNLAACALVASFSAAWVSRPAKQARSQLLAGRRQIRTTSPCGCVMA